MDTSKDNPFAYSLDFLDRLNNLRYKGNKLSEQTIFGQYNVWMFFQNRIFFNDLKEVRAGKKDFQDHGLTLKEWILGLGTIIISFSAAAIDVVFRKKVLVYSIDRTNSTLAQNDARLDGIYAFLMKHGLSYRECLHAVIDRSLFTRLFARHRLALYMRSIDVLYRLCVMLGLVHLHKIDLSQVDFGAFAPDEVRTARSLAKKYLSLIPVTVFKVKVLERILRITRPRAILSIDNPRDYNELVLAAKLAHIPMIAFQHGHFTKYHVGWLRRGLKGEVARPEMLYVWSEFWKSELISLGTYFEAEEIVIGGAKGNLPISSRGKSQSKKLEVLIPYEVDSIKSEVKSYIDEMLATGQIKVIFKVRTDLSREDQIKASLLDGFSHEDFSVVSSLSDALQNADVVAGTYSTFLYDMIAYDVPVVLLDTPNDFGEGIVRNGLGSKVGHTHLYESLHAAADTPSGVLRGRKEKLFGNPPVLLSETLHNIAKRYSLI